MTLIRTVIASLALLLTAQSERAGDVAVVIGRPVKILGDLGPDVTGHYSRLNVRMKVAYVMSGKFKDKYFDAIVLRHVPRYVFDTAEYVAVIETREGKRKIVELTEMQKIFCLENNVVSRHSLTKEFGPPRDHSDYDNATCWDSDF